MKLVQEIINKDTRPNLEKKAFEEVIKALSMEEKAHAMVILLEWAKSLKQ